MEILNLIELTIRDCGKQNSASSTSVKTEIKLLNVAKASLLELLEDYEDYLKVCKLW